MLEEVKMQIVVAHPPNIEEIDKVFHVKDQKNILYAFGNKIFNPSGVEISDHILAHEQVHAFRQGANPERWWASYLNNSSFRLDEELYSHRTEWAVFCKQNTDRNVRNKYFHFMCQRLAGPLYNNLLTVPEARKRILMLEG